MQESLILLLLFAGITASLRTGCNWTGHMPGPGGSSPCPWPVASQRCPVTPSYYDLLNKGKLWPCPSYGRAQGAKYYTNNCTTGSGRNPLCHFDATSPTFGCCCPQEDCWSPPHFNWIIGVCKGRTCGGYNNAPSTKKYKNTGTNLIVNYAATYQWNTQRRVWEIQPESSFNTDGSRPAFDTIKPNGGHNGSAAWMQPQPGGASAWSWGYYPAGVRGAGPPGMLFVLSVESVWNVAWYMLNQETLDRGPASGYPSNKCAHGINDNCWSSGNAGQGWGWLTDLRPRLRLDLLIRLTG